MNQRAIPPTSELFPRHTLVQRHPNLLNGPRVQWALRNRAKNGLAEAVFESKSGELVIHEPTFLRWFLGLSGRAKPRASARRKGHAREAASMLVPDTSSSAARKLGIPLSTLIGLEKRSIVGPFDRDSAGRRLLTPKHIEQLRAYLAQPKRNRPSVPQVSA